MISLILAASVFANSAKVVIPASLSVEAIFGPIPSTFLRSSPLVDFFGAAAFTGAAFLASSFFGAAFFLAPEVAMLSITISERACL
jgi:hypothetical protein